MLTNIGLHMKEIDIQYYYGKIYDSIYEHCKSGAMISYYGHVIGHINVFLTTVYELRLLKLLLGNARVENDRFFSYHSLCKVYFNLKHLFLNFN